MSGRSCEGSTSVSATTRPPSSKTITRLLSLLGEQPLPLIDYGRGPVCCRTAA